MLVTERSKGFFCGIIAAVTYGLNPLFAKPLYKAGLTPDNVLFYRYVFALIGLVLMVKLNGSSFRIKRNEMPWALLNGVLMCLS
ncbi:MAG: EamA family transporter, partial [Lentisphaeria bacterium]|nr:EamA family transporter [Lentisphaeria bacterium]